MFLFVYTLCKLLYPSACIVTSIYVCVCVGGGRARVRTLEIYCLTKFQVYNALLLTIDTIEMQKLNWNMWCSLEQDGFLGSCPGWFEE